MLAGAQVLGVPPPEGALCGHRPRASAFLPPRRGSLPGAACDAHSLPVDGRPNTRLVTQPGACLWVLPGEAGFAMDYRPSVRAPP